MRKVLVTGTFDLLHKGHLNFFAQAKEHGDHLTVVVARDSTVEYVKGERPRYSEKKRLKAVRDAEGVNKAVLGNEFDKYKVVEEEAPDVICLGYDQEAFTENLDEKLSERGLDVEIRVMDPYKPEKYKSSKLKEKVKNDKAVSKRGVNR